MRFVFRMARREMRSSWKRLLFFFVCIALGVAAIVTLRSAVQSVRGALVAEARALTAADALLQSNEPWSDRAREIFAARFARPPVVSHMHSVETTTMVRPEEEDIAAAIMVELRAVEREFPYYGELRLRSGRAYEHGLLAGGGALVAPELLSHLGVRVGDRLWIGEKLFTVRDLILREPGRSLDFFNLGPRVLIDFADLEETGIVRFGSRVRHQILLRVSASESELEHFLEELEDDLAAERVRVRSFRDTGERVDRRLTRSEDYLSLAGFVIVVLGGIGVSSVIRVFIHQKLKSIAVLKCLGATSRRILAIYLLEVVALGLGGSLMGVALAGAALDHVPPSIIGQMEHLDYRLTGSAVAQGVGIGILVALLFSLVPLLEVRRVKPLLLLRHGEGEKTGPRAARFRGAQAVATGVLLVCLVLLAIWQSGSLRVGAYVCAGFAGVAAVLYVAGGALVRALPSIARRSRYPLRHAVMGLGRPGNQTRVILLAVGLGSFFLLAMHSVERNLLRELELGLGEDTPDMFLIDIQHDQAEPLRAAAASLGATHINLVPVLRARVVGVEGAAVTLRGYEEVRERGSLGREYVITFRDHLEENERIVDGRFWSSGEVSEPEVSIEDSLRDRYDIDLGDLMRFDVMGREIAARVTSIREVEWSDARSGGFMFVFHPAPFEDAPAGFIGFMKAPPDPAARARLQRDLVASFRNVSILDLRQVLQDLQTILDKIALGISVIGVIVLVSGVLILAGSLVMTKFQRRYETAIYRTLGAKKKSLAAMMLFEYGTLGALAGVVGAGGALLLSFAVADRILEISWTVEPAAIVAGVALTAIGVSVVGVATTLDVLGVKPLSILRAE